MPEDLASLEAAFEAAAPRPRAELVGRIANDRAAGAFDRHRAGLDWMQRPPREVPALRRAALFLMVKDEAEIIWQNLSHHYALGFRRFFILDNASTDNTAGIIAAFRDAHPDAALFSAFDYVVGHYQALKMKALMAFMDVYLHYESVQPDWIFLVDADEFVTCVGPDGEAEHRLAALLDDPSLNMLVLHWVQCGSDEVLDVLPPGGEILALFPRAWSRMKVPVTKVAFRTRRGLEPIQGNHLVGAFPYPLSSVAVLAEAGIYMFHFPTRTVEQLRRKVVNANRALSATVDQDGLSDTATHWRTYYQWYQQAGDAALRQVIAEHNRSCAEP